MITQAVSIWLVSAFFPRCSEDSSHSVSVSCAFPLKTTQVSWAKTSDADSFLFRRTIGRRFSGKIEMYICNKKEVCFFDLRTPLLQRVLLRVCRLFNLLLSSSVTG